ncbi:serine carboxypeptidase S28, putative [Trypanosoma cruzi]|uniref:Serine carboxypeptidase S28 n=2 Tax=Trypanosoma cruzi TaxID=5693 RepID=V5B0C7_TRYCR|nr:serine carboxypeptidase S28, putative [Trypanosoma cruzi]ESS66565.1 serine carboxypeptidase S28 [Trypanosoma cruzi Dm28c]PBJ77579.1 serine carboxypeptidase S28 [Trypanosoma cruzi cruzi]KAF8305744.1 putative serine carboxypeptidase S28 [Trypanosoma cruzi]PWU89680.1 putative serine carboxypeptidase S28 [Trypanosoma cruzi]
MKYCLGAHALIVMLGLLAVAFSGPVTALHPSVIPSRARHGEVYRAALRRSLKEGSGGQEKQRHDVHNNAARYYNQRVDHADATLGTFRQRWWVDRSSWDVNSGPAILLVNGEGTAHGLPDGGFVGEYGKSVKAIVFSLEHRYYGESMPAPLTNRSMLKYLTVENALADLQAFKKYAEKKVVKKKVKWLIVGGSYAGALSAWARAKYPGDFDAAWSSSGVVNAIFDYEAFDGHLLEVLPSSCAAAVRTVFNKFSKAYDNPNRRAKMMKIFGTPNYFTKSDMAWMLADGAAMAIQYGYKDKLCSSIEFTEERALFKRYAEIMKLLWGEEFTRSCYYSTECLSNPSYSESWKEGYAWAYQCCSQLAYWQTGFPGSLRPREVNTSYFMYQCRAAFGEAILPDTYAFNKKHGGAHPDATRVVATQALDDPWLTAGAKKAIDEDYPVITAQCNGCGHCGELAATNPLDHPSLKAQRRAVKFYLKQWLGI